MRMGMRVGIDRNASQLWNAGERILAQHTTTAREGSGRLRLGDNRMEDKKVPFYYLSCQTAKHTRSKDEERPE